MLRNMIIKELNNTKFENLLSMHLHSTCIINATPRKVVTEIITFLLLHGFNDLITALDDNAPIRDIVLDFKTVVLPCLIYAGTYQEHRHV